MPSLHKLIFAPCSKKNNQPSHWHQQKTNHPFRRIVSRGINVVPCRAKRKKRAFLEKSVYSERRKGHSKRPKCNLQRLIVCASKKTAAATDMASQKYQRQLCPFVKLGEKRAFPKKKGCSQRKKGVPKEKRAFPKKKQALQKTCGGIAR